MKYVLVPQEDIDRIERARIKLHEITEKMHGTKQDIYFQNWYVCIPDISEPMWHLTHRKYKESLLSKILNWLTKEKE